jgi:hypothetical protein
VDRAALWLFVPLIPVLFAVKVESIAGSFLRITINVVVTTAIIYLLFSGQTVCNSIRIYGSISTNL